MDRGTSLRGLTDSPAIAHTCPPINTSQHVRHHTQNNSTELFTEMSDDKGKAVRCAALHCIACVCCWFAKKTRNRNRQNDRSKEPPYTSRQLTEKLNTSHLPRPSFLYQTLLEPPRDTPPPAPLNQHWFLWEHRPIPPRTHRQQPDGGTSITPPLAPRQQKPTVRYAVELVLRAEMPHIAPTNDLTLIWVRAA